MSADLLQRISDGLASEGLLTGYDIKFFRWLDSDVQESGKFVLFRQEGTADDSDIHVQRTDVRILLVEEPTGAVTGDEAAQAIVRYLRSGDTPEGLIKIHPTAPVIGPVYLENDRPVFEINARAYTEDL